MTEIKLREKLKTGVFLSRLNRFMVEAQLGNSRVLAHLPNSGRLVTVLVPEATAFLQQQSPVGRKSSYDLFAVEHSGVPIIVDTCFSTIAAQTAIKEGLFDSLRGFQVLRSNARVNNSLLDLLLRSGERKFFLEIKCVTHVVDGVAMFPDAPTQRGRKHLKTLIALTEKGIDAGLLFSVQRPDAKRIRPYHEMDPLFSQFLKEATEKGVKIFTQTLIFKRPDTVEVKADSPVFSHNS
jgi:sugar fermentation stimulation protein A